MEMNLFGEGGGCLGPGRRSVRAFEWRRKRLTGEHLGASLYALPPDQATFPYHYELGNDEVLVVVAGAPTLRSSEGERMLEPGDCVLFPSGESGAHQVINRSETEVRVLLVSNLAMPRASVQPDSRKMMIRWGPEANQQVWFPLGAAADYWQGEERPGDG